MYVVIKTTTIIIMHSYITLWVPLWSKVWSLEYQKVEIPLKSRTSLKCTHVFLGPYQLLLKIWWKYFWNLLSHNILSSWGKVRLKKIKMHLAKSRAGGITCYLFIRDLDERWNNRVINPVLQDSNPVGCSVLPGRQHILQKPPEPR